MSFDIPDEDAASALVMRSDGTGCYGVYKDARPGWRTGYIVITKKSKRAKRRTKWVGTRKEAEEMLDKHFQ